MVEGSRGLRRGAVRRLPRPGGHAERGHRPHLHRAACTRHGSTVARWASSRSTPRWRAPRSARRAGERRSGAGGGGARAARRRGRAVVVKHAVGRFAARSVAPAEACRRIREGATAALARRAPAVRLAAAGPARGGLRAHPDGRHGRAGAGLGPHRRPDGRLTDTTITARCSGPGGRSTTWRAWSRRNQAGFDCSTRSRRTRSRSGMRRPGSARCRAG